MEAPEQLRITWAHGQEFLSAYDREASRFSVAVPHSNPVLRRTSVGEQLLVEHEFVDGRNANLVVCHAEGQSVPYLNRRVERRPVWLPIEYGPRSLHGIITELSELGAFITTKHASPEGTITLRLPANNARLAITAKVLYTRHLHEPGFAVEFVFAHRDDEVTVQAAIRKALQTNQRK